jgi:nucleoside-diphosphate-sugar epimerase
LRALQNLLSLSLSTPTTQPAKLVFCSSVSTALGTKPPAIIPSAPLSSLNQASPTGYGRSKLVAEKILEQATNERNARTAILRIGQITPSREAERTKLWNPTEMIPLLIRSAAVVNALPDRGSGSGGNSCEWIEVGLVAKIVMDVCGFTNTVDNGQLVYNIMHPTSFSWEKDLLPKLRDAGVNFETVGYSEWLRKVSQSNPDVEKNPSRKLVGFWESQRRQEGLSEDAVKFDTNSMVEICPAMKDAPRVVDGDLVKAMVQAWRESGAHL